MKPYAKVSHLQMAHFKYSFDESKPGKILVDTSSNLLGEFASEYPKTSLKSSSSHRF